MSQGGGMHCESKLFGIIQILWIPWKLLYLVTCIFLPRAFTCCTMSIMSRARFAILTACFEHLVGKPLTAMYLSPTVSTCYTNFIFSNQYINILLMKIDWSHLTSFLHFCISGNRHLVSSIGRVPVCCVGGWGFEPQTVLTFKSFRIRTVNHRPRLLHLQCYI